MSGWKRSNQVARALGTALVLMSPAGVAKERVEEPLPEAFLEFLTEWEDERGEWQDPMEYEDPQWQVLDQKVGQTDE